MLPLNVVGGWAVDVRLCIICVGVDNGVWMILILDSALSGVWHV